VAKDKIIDYEYGDSRFPMIQTRRETTNVMGVTRKSNAETPSRSRNTDVLCIVCRSFKAEDVDLAVVGELSA